MTTMEPDNHLERHLKLCQQIYERMKRDGTWPWREKPDSPNSLDVVDSDGTNDDA